MKFNVLAAGFVCLILLAVVGACEKSPREGVVLFAGSTTLVGGGRAVVTLLDTEEVINGATGDTLFGALLRIRCAGESHELTALPGPWTEAPCGVRLRVNEVFQQTLPTVVLDIEWE